MPAGRPDRGIEVADADTFDAFYRGSNQRLYDCVYAITGNRSEAQDAVHEAYARAWQRWNTVGDYADAVALIAALARLPVAQRTAIVLHHLVGLPVAEVAEETRVPVGTVKARLARGRRALATLLDMTLPEDSSV